MRDKDKIQDQLLKELKELKKQNASLESEVSQSRKIKESLQESEAKNKAIFDSATDFIYIIDCNNKVLFLNQAAAELFNQEPKDLMGKSIFELFPEEVVKNYSKNLKKVFKTGRSYSSETRIVAGNKESWISATLSPVIDRKGKVTSVIGISRDITESKKRIEESLRESEEKLRTMFESIREGIVITDLEANILEVNNAILRMGKYSKKAELVGQNALDFVSPRDRKRVLLNMKREIDVGYTREEVEFSLVAKDGTEFEVESSATVIHDSSGNPIALVNVLRDITERKRDEEKLNQSERFLHSVFDGIQDGISVLDSELNIIRVNQWMEKMYADKVPFIGKKCYTVYQSRESVCPWCPAIKTLETGEINTDIVPYPSSENPTGWIELSTYPIKDEDNNVIKLIEHVKDITDRKFAEEEKERLNEELVKKNKELEQIIYATSHDLRSPLVNIQGFSKELDYSIDELMADLNIKEIPKNVKKKISSILKEDIPESMKYIQNSISKMDSLLSGLLRLSRIGRRALNLEKLDMNKLISSVVYTFEFLIKEKGVKLHISELPECKGDRSQINQVFSNILDNAIKYLKPRSPGVVKISGYRKNDNSVYCVADSGRGISQKEMEKIFGIFYQIDPDKSSGEGLGLTIVNRIVDRHNGEVWVESKSGKGSKFFISLPSG